MATQQTCSYLIPVNQLLIIWEAPDHDRWNRLVVFFQQRALLNAYGCSFTETFRALKFYGCHGYKDPLHRIMGFKKVTQWYFRDCQKNGCV